MADGDASATESGGVMNSAVERSRYVYAAVQAPRWQNRRTA